MANANPARCRWSSANACRPEIPVVPVQSIILLGHLVSERGLSQSAGSDAIAVVPREEPLSPAVQSHQPARPETPMPHIPPPFLHRLDGPRAARPSRSMLYPVGFPARGLQARPQIGIAAPGDGDECNMHIDGWRKRRRPARTARAVISIPSPSDGSLDGTEA